MSCDTCFQAKTLPRCMGLLTIGTIDASTDYKIRFKSANGRIDYIDATSDTNGLLVADLTGFEIMESAYIIIVKKKSDGSTAQITIGSSDPSDCIEVSFEDGLSDAEMIEAHAA